MSSVLRKWPIARLVPLVVLVLLVGSVAAVALAFVQRSRTADAEKDLGRHVAAQLQVDRFAFLDVRAKMYNAQAVAYPGADRTAKPAEQADIAEMGQIIQSFERTDLPANEKSLLLKIGEAYQAYVDWSANIKPEDTATPAGMARIAAEYTEVTDAQSAATAQAQQVLAAGLKKAQDQMHDAVRSLLLLVFALAVAGGLLLTAAFALFGRQLVGRLGVLATALRRVSDGDLTVTVDADGRDEVSRMAGDVNAMTERLRAVFSAVGETNGRLVGASTGLEDIAARVGRSAEEASSRAEVVARSADEVSQNVQAVASGSEEVGALIAAIAAARAGAAGKGFAVVADEVKQLAQETARATEDISRRVETIQEDADQAARAIADIAGVITRINEFQTTIASAVEEQTATTQAINAGVTEAASGSNQIAHNIAGVADAAGQTATSMTDARDSARQLAGMSDELSRLIQGFRV
jgi:methyl-accepting chemotaxis protein